LDFDGDLYDQAVRIEFMKRIRDEIRFDSLDALRTQILLDAQATRAYFSNL
jgi:riboflavin kinase/FMN adenylyltransferase